MSMLTVKRQQKHHSFFVSKSYCLAFSALLRFVFSHVTPASSLHSTRIEERAMRLPPTVATTKHNTMSHLNIFTTTHQRIAKSPLSSSPSSYSSSTFHIGIFTHRIPTKCAQNIAPLIYTQTVATHPRPPTRPPPLNKHQPPSLYAILQHRRHVLRSPLRIEREA
nr:hypothetical transcript [Hymenolepis microstoma]